jgi:hypothetical protein
MHKKSFLQKRENFFQQTQIPSDTDSDTDLLLRTFMVCHRATARLAGLSCYDFILIDIYIFFGIHPRGVFIIEVENA